MGHGFAAALARPVRHVAHLSATQRSVLGAIVALLLAGAAFPCAADIGVAVQGRARDDIKSLGVQVILPQWFETERGGWRVTGYPELQVNRFERSGDDLVQGGAFATFRVDPARASLRPYFEGGVGVNLFSRDRLASKTFATRFQFGEHLGLGVTWGGGPGASNETWFGMRISHYSNATIRRPNPGIEALQFVIGHRF
jgi:lipid A 3-O-deacylase